MAVATKTILPRELLANVRKIEIRTRRIVDDLTAGAYHSVFKGRGIEFDEVREYTSDDDVRDIDWNVTARMGSPFIKTYVEERELTVVLAVDISASQDFGSGKKTKRERSAEIAALLALSAIRNNDKVGLLLFSDRSELFLPPRSGRSHGLRLIRELLARQPESRKTDIHAALGNLMTVLHKRAVVFMISDFLTELNYASRLRAANQRHDLVAVRILDQVEKEWPRIPGIRIEDAENGNSVSFPGGNRAVKLFADSANRQQQAVADTCRRAKVDLIDLDNSDEFVKPLMHFFKKRQARR